MEPVEHSSQLWTRNALSSEFRLNYRRVTRLLKDVEPDGMTGNGYEGYLLTTAVPVLYGHTELLQDGEINPDLLDPKERRDWYEGSRAKMRLAEEAGQLVPADVMRREMSLVVTAMVNEIENLPDILERDCGFGIKAILKAEQAVHNVRMLATRPVKPFQMFNPRYLNQSR